MLVYFFYRNEKKTNTYTTGSQFFRSFEIDIISFAKVLVFVIENGLEPRKNSASAT